MVFLMGQAAGAAAALAAKAAVSPRALDVRELQKLLHVQQGYPWATRIACESWDSPEPAGLLNTLIEQNWSQQ